MIENAAAVANQRFLDLVSAINSRIHAPRNAQAEAMACEQKARQEYEAALTRWLGGKVKA